MKPPAKRRQTLNSLHRYMYDKLVRNLDMSDDEIAEELDFARLIREKADYFDKTLSFRTTNRRELLSQYNFDVISLGYNCLPRTLCAKYGLIQSRSKGRKSGPFDLSVHPMAAVSRLLDTKFLDYENPDLYYLGKDSVPRLKGYEVIFNHDTGEELFQNAFAGLIEKNKKRVEDFDISARGENVVFIANIGRAGPKDVIAVYESVRLINSTAPILFLQLGYRSEPLGLDLENAEFLVRPVPRQNYFWHLPRDFMTTEGMKFEEDIVQAIVKFIKNNSRPYNPAENQN